MITRASELPWGGGGMGGWVDYEMTCFTYIYMMVPNFKKDLFRPVRWKTKKLFWYWNDSKRLTYLKCDFYWRNLPWKRFSSLHPHRLELGDSPPSPPSARSVLYIVSRVAGQVAFTDPADHHYDGRSQLLSDCRDVWRWTSKTRSRSTAAAAV